MFEKTIDKLFKKNTPLQNASRLARTEKYIDDSREARGYPRVKNMEYELGWKKPSSWGSLIGAVRTITRNNTRALIRAKKLEPHLRHIISRHKRGYDGLDDSKSEEYLKGRNEAFSEIVEELESLLTVNR